MVHTVQPAAERAAAGPGTVLLTLLPIGWPVLEGVPRSIALPVSAVGIPKLFPDVSPASWSGSASCPDDATGEKP